MDHETNIYQDKRHQKTFYRDLNQKRVITTGLAHLIIRFNFAVFFLRMILKVLLPHSGPPGLADWRTAGSGKQSVYLNHVRVFFFDIIVIVSR